MKHLPFVIALAGAGLMATVGAAQAQASSAQASSPPPKRTPPPASRQAAPPAAEAPRGDTPVHKFFQSWGRGMDKAGEALDKVPKPDKRWPGKANTQRPPDTSPKGDPYSSP